MATTPSTSQPASRSTFAAFNELPPVDIKSSNFEILFKKDQPIDIDALRKGVEDAGFSVALLKLKGEFNNVEIKKDWFDQMERGVQSIKKSNIVYVYKDVKGLMKRNDGVKEWFQDPEQIVETLFFKKHYPCSSFVVISEKGDYISYFGEFPKEYVWNAMKILSD